MKYIKAKKKYGQNFLKNPVILDKIANSIMTNKNDLIIEIGPGMGALTKRLKLKESNLLAYEIDERMHEYLDLLVDEKTNILYTDFLKSNVLLDASFCSYEKVYVIANIPYYITSPILEKIANLDFIEEVTIMVQKEVAERIVKDNNALSLFLDFFFASELLFLVGKNNFVPSPKVDSAVICLTRKENINLEIKDQYLKFIRDAFRNRRKTLKNNLGEYDWSKMESILNKYGYSELIRAEDIKREDFKNIFKEYIGK